MKTFEEILERIRNIEFVEDFDLIVAVANGGIIPAALLNQRLGLELQLLRVNLRDLNQRPLYDSPKLLRPIDFDFGGRNILLVEDRVKTGASLSFARSLLEKEAEMVRTFAVNGKADYSLYDEDCFRFPWIL
jgi:xanthine phosphoribosyltransferase